MSDGRLQWDASGYGGYGTALKAYGRAMLWENVLSLLSDMRRSCVSPNKRALSSAIGTCGRSRKWQLALLLFSRIGDPDIVACNVVISACEKGQRWLAAMELFQSLGWYRLQPTIVTFGAIASACEKDSRWEEALSFFPEIRKASLEIDRVFHNVVLSACEKGRQWCRALHVFSDMCAMRSQPDLISFNATLSACEKGHRWEYALDLFRRAGSIAINPDVISYNATMSACEKGMQWELTFVLLDEIRKNVMDPSLVTFNVVMSACERVQRWEAAIDVMENALSRNLKPSAVTFNVLISACGKSGQWAMALRLFQQMDNLCLQIDDPAHAMKMASLASTGNLVGALAAFREGIAAGAARRKPLLLGGSPWCLDLHGLQPDEARLAICATLLDAAGAPTKLEEPNGISSQPSDFVFVTGQGKRSPEGISFLTPAVIELLQHELGLNAQEVEGNAGRVWLPAEEVYYFLEGRRQR